MASASKQRHKNFLVQASKKRCLVIRLLEWLFWIYHRAEKDWMAVRAAAFFTKKLSLRLHFKSFVLFCKLHLSNSYSSKHSVEILKTAYPSSAAKVAFSWQLTVCPWAVMVVSPFCLNIFKWLISPCFFTWGVLEYRKLLSLARKIDIPIDF